MNDGGPAFPALTRAEHDGEQGKDYFDYSEAGMTLRDYFAGQALVALIGQIGHSMPAQDVAEGIRAGAHEARAAYAYADAMIAAREKKNG